MCLLGFILQPTYRVQGGRPVVHLFGCAEGGGSFLVRDDRETPRFYVGVGAESRARSCGARVRPSRRQSLDGEPVLRVDVAVPSDTPPLRDRLRAEGIVTYEADVRFGMRYLIDRGIRGGVEIEGSPRQEGPIDYVFDNPEVRPAGWMPTLRVLSIDIETDPKAERLLSIALAGCGASEVLLLTPEGASAPRPALPFASEAELLAAFCRRVQELDPDVITGWNVVDFDLRVLERLARRSKALELGRAPGTLRVVRGRGAGGGSEARIPGRVVLDGIRLLRGAFIKQDDYALDAVARDVLGEGKLLTGDDRGEAILEAFHHDRRRFVDYNLNDAELVLRILERLRVVELAVERSLLTGMPIDRVSSSIAAFDFLYLSELGRRGVVAPSVGAVEREGGANLGGYVLEPETGLYRNVLVFDFTSLYPSLIRTFQIDPLGYLPDPGAEGREAVVAPNGAAFRRRPGVLPGLLDELFPRRKEAKAAGDSVKSHAIKILMNSFYGVLGTSACRFYRPQIAGAITSFGRELLLWCRDQVEEYGYRVLYGDTDSLFVLAGTDDPALAEEKGELLAHDLNRDLAEHVAEKWGVESRLEIGLERLYRRLLLPSMRHGGGGARKRYVGLVGDGAEAEVVFTGMESVRSDWTELAKRVQRELYVRLFGDRRVDEYLATVVSELRGGLRDEELVYRKALRKRLSDYTATTPPHVAAARKLSRRRPPRRIAYVMTVDGAEPLEERRSALDHEHYVQRQIRPVAEPVLAVLGLDFDKVIGDDAQLELF